MRQLLYTFLFLTFFALPQVQAQMTSVPGGSVSTPGGPVRTNNWIMNPKVNMIKLNKKQRFNPRSVYEIRIVLLNDSIIYAGAKMDTSSGKKAIKIDDKIITPNETKEIVFPVEGGEFLKGIPRDSCWIFKTTGGLINAYSATPETDNKEIVALQKLTGEIFPFTKELLLEWLKSDPKAVKLAEKDKFIEAIKLYNQ